MGSITHQDGELQVNGDTKINTDSAICSSFPFIDQINAPSGQCSGNQVMRIEGFAQAPAGGDCPDKGNQGVVNSYLTDGITAEQFVIERKSGRGDTDQ